MQSPLVESACLIVGNILLYFCLKDPNKGFTKEDRVQNDIQGASGFIRLLLMKYSFLLFTFTELCLCLMPRPTHPYFLVVRPGTLENLPLGLSLAHKYSSLASSLRLLSFPIFVASGAFRLWAMHTLGEFFTFTLSIREGHKLISDGPYAYVRNPSYTGLYGFIGSGTIIMITSELAERIVGLRTTLTQTGWLGTTLLTISGITAIRIAHRNVIAPRIKNEETMLEGTFGPEWEEYTKKVPYRVLPHVW